MVKKLLTDAEKDIARKYYHKHKIKALEGFGPGKFYTLLAEWTHENSHVELVDMPFPELKGLLESRMLEANYQNTLQAKTDLYYEQQRPLGTDKGRNKFYRTVSEWLDKDDRRTSENAPLDQLLIASERQHSGSRKHGDPDGRNFWAATTKESLRPIGSGVRGSRKK